MTNEKVMRLALDALEYNEANWQGKNKALEALYAALVQPEREWQGLTDEDIAILWTATPQLVGVYSYTDIAREVEAKLKEKNT